MTYEQLQQEYSKFVVTGFFYNSTKRFRMETSSAIAALNINLWRGNVWGVKNGKRTRIKKVTN